MCKVQGVNFISYLGGYENPFFYFLFFSLSLVFTSLLMFLGEIFFQFSCLVILVLLESGV